MIFYCLLCYLEVIIFKFWILCSNYHGARADRICKMMGKQSGYIFSFKCLLIRKTLQINIYNSSGMFNIIIYVESN